MRSSPEKVRAIIDASSLWVSGILSDENDPADIFRGQAWSDVMAAVSSDRYTWDAFAAWQRLRMPQASQPSVAGATDAMRAAPQETQTRPATHGLRRLGGVSV